MAVKKLVVCGCSFMTSSYNQWQLIRGSDWPEYPLVNNIETGSLPEFIVNELKNRRYQHNYSFLDRYVREKNFEYTNLSQGGESNFFIRMQISQAIDQKADYVIIGATEPTRIEIPISFEYEKDYSHAWEVNSKKYIVSTMIKELDTRVTKELKNSMKHYVTYLQDLDIETKKSYYLLRGGLADLEKNKIQYVFIPGPLKNQDWSQNNIVWPNNESQPWDRQYGTDSKHNHNGEQAHNDYYQTLLKITKNWK